MGMNRKYCQKDFVMVAPHSPYCSNNFEYGLKIRKKDLAIKHKNIQHSPKDFISFLVFDYDKPGVLLAAQDANLPEPTWITENPETRTGHIVYALETPVYKGKGAKKKPIEYVNAIRKAFTKILGSDPSYNNLITKTPGHKEWNTVYGRSELYSLDELADYILNYKDILKVKELSRLQEDEAAILGRNDRLFKTIKKIAYKEKKNFSDLDDFQLFIFKLAKGINLEQNPLNPLGEREVLGIAKSISKWCFTKLGAGVYGKAFKERGEKARKKALKVLKKRSKKRKAEIKKLRNKSDKSGKSLTDTQIAEMVGVSVHTVKRYGASKREDWKNKNKERNLYILQLRTIGYSNKEIAEKLGMTVNAVKIVVSRNRAQLDEFLEKMKLSEQQTACYLDKPAKLFKVSLKSKKTVKKFLKKMKKDDKGNMGKNQKSLMKDDDLNISTSTDVYDEADFAQYQQLIEQNIIHEKAKALFKAEYHPDFDGEHCIDCDIEIPERRLQMGRIRCIECQEAIEKREKIISSNYLKKE